MPMNLQPASLIYTMMRIAPVLFLVISLSSCSTNWKNYWSGNNKKSNQAAIRPAGSSANSDIPPEMLATLQRVAMESCCGCEDEEKDACLSKAPYYIGPHPGRNGLLTPEEMNLARVAWKYFQNNYQDSTGLVNAVNDYPSTTLWDTGSYLGGLVAAYELGIVCKDEFDRRMSNFIRTLNNLDLFRGELPNKAYNTQTGAKVDYGNNPGEIGYSALDIGRLLIWLKIIKGRYPEYSDGIDNGILRWNFCNVIDKCGTMYGAILDGNNNVQYVQEGRLGYEEYAAKGFQLWGFETERATKMEPFDFVPIYDVMVPYDTRDPRELTAHNYVVCESYVLDGIELNWDLSGDPDTDDMYHSDPIIAEFAQRIYKVQERRHEETGILTARTEHQLDGAPYFVYDTIYTDGFPWNTITEDGQYVPQFSAIALKGAFGLWTLWDTPYTDMLYDAISGLYNPQKGFYEGRYERDNSRIDTFTANNNGIILETLLYKVQGKLAKHFDKKSRWDRIVEDEFTPNDKCYPGQDESCGPGKR